MQSALSSTTPMTFSYYDLDFFSQWCWKDDPDHKPNADFHREIYEILQYKGELGEKFRETHRLHIEAPRYHAKTTAISVKYVLWRIGRNPNIRVVVISRTGALSQDINREVRRNIENNPRYQRVFPEIEPDSPWGDERFQVKRSKIMKDATFYGTGLEGSVTGIRADLLILDDPFDLNNVMTEGQREKVRNWIESVTVSILPPSGEMICVGTRWHEDDYWGTLLSKSVENDGNWVCKVYTAIENYEDPPEKWRLLWPEAWTWETLVQRREDIGSLRFKSLYQNDPSGLSGALFKHDWLTFYDPLIMTPEFTQNFDYVMGVDPAISESPEADRTAIARIAHDVDRGDIYVLDMYADRHDFPSQVKLIEEWALRRPLPNIQLGGRIRKVGIEANAYQQALSKTAYIRMLPVIEVRQKKNKDARMLGLQPHFENGRIKFPDPRYGASSWWEQFQDEYLAYPRGRHDDMMDALQLAFEMVDPDRASDTRTFEFGPPLGYPWKY